MVPEYCLTPKLLLLINWLTLILKSFGPFHVPIGQGCGAVTVTTAVAVLLGSATLVALILYVPGVVLLKVTVEVVASEATPLTVQVTAVLLAPITVAVKSTVPFVDMLADVGLMDTPAGVTVTAAVSLLAGSATLVAVMW